VVSEPAIWTGLFPVKVSCGTTYVKSYVLKVDTIEEVVLELTIAGALIEPH
jgi:hypothetical protein